MTTAYVFPGQGVQRVGMGVDAAQESPEAAAVFQEASEALGIDLLAACRDGPAEELARTELTQPAVLAASLAYAAAARPWLPEPSHVAGMSLGEYTALVVAGAMTLPDAARLVRARGQLMARACAGRAVGMAAVEGLDTAVVEDLCAAVRHAGRCETALYNAPRQLTVAGDEAALSLLVTLAERLGAEVTRLRVSSAFHTSLMGTVAADLAGLLTDTPIVTPAVPVIANVTGEPVHDPAHIRACLTRQLDHPVQWTASIRRLARSAVDTVVELGPGSVLSGLCAQISPELTTLSIRGRRSLLAAKEHFQGGAAVRTGEPVAGLPGFVPVPAERARRYRAAGYWAGQTLHEAILAGAERQPPTGAALVGEDQTVAYGNLRGAVENLASHLVALGVDTGDRVVVQLPNSPAFALLVMALWRVGAIAVMALPSYGVREMGYVMDTCGATAVAVAPRRRRDDPLAGVRSLRRDRPWLGTVLTLGEVPDRQPGEVDLARLPDRPAGRPLRQGGTRSHEVALLLMSGGTTGLPKLIPRTHDDYLYNVRISAEICQLDASTVYGAVLPVAHNFALGCPGILGTLLCGGTVVFAPRPDPPTVIRTLTEHSVTLTALVPTLATQVAEVLGDRGQRAASLRVLQVGGARLLPHAAAAVTGALGCTVQQVYGMAEGLLNFTRLDDPQEVILQTQGRPASAADEIRIVDHEGTEVPVGEVGELWTRGPYTIAGYYPADRAGGDAFTRDGFYRTGDVVRRHHSGNLVVEGRVKDVINRGGEKVSPAELEDLILRVPAVRQVAAVPMPDEALGEGICVCVSLRSTDPLTLTEIRKFLADRGVARYKLPDRLEIVDELPLTALGKPDKVALRRRLAGECA